LSEQDFGLATFGVFKMLRKLRMRRLIRESHVSDISLIDPTAKLSHSQLCGPVSVGYRTVLDYCRITANCPTAIGNHSILTGPIRIVADIEPVSIGKFCSLAPDVAIWESLHDARRLSTFFIFSELCGAHFAHDLISKGPIRIGNDVWIGTKAVILSGVEIGDGAVIGAGAVVTKNVPPYALAAGVPAAFVKFRFPDPIRQRLLQLRWWDWDEDTIRRNRILFEQKLTPELLDHLAC
jgi:virginiamycin A acetyltransferase